MTMNNGKLLAAAFVLATTVGFGGEALFTVAKPAWFVDKAAVAGEESCLFGRWFVLDETPTRVRLASDAPCKIHFSGKFVGWVPGDGLARDIPLVNGKGAHEFKLEVSSAATYVIAEIVREDGTVLGATGVDAKSDILIRSWVRGADNGEIPAAAVGAGPFPFATMPCAKLGSVAFRPVGKRRWLYRVRGGETQRFRTARPVNGFPTASLFCCKPGRITVRWGEGEARSRTVVRGKEGGCGFTVMEPCVFDGLVFTVEDGEFEIRDAGCATLVDGDLAETSLVCSDAKLNAAFAAAKATNDRKTAFGVLVGAVGLKALDEPAKTVTMDPTVRNGLTHCGARIGVKDGVLDLRWKREEPDEMATVSQTLPDGWTLVRDFDMQAECQRLCESAVADGLQVGVQFCAYRDGKCIVDAFAGKLAKGANAAAVKGDSLFPIFSTEKPLLSTACHRAVERGLMDYDKPLCTWWPELTGDGKEKLTLRETLGYRTCMPGGAPGGKGNPVCDHPMNNQELCDWDRVCRAAAADRPHGVPGTVQAYLPYAYAWMVGHPLEVAMKKPLKQVLDDEVLIPSGIEREFYFVVPRTEYPRVATFYDGAFCENMNYDWCRQALLPSAWAVSSARALGKFYNRLCGFDGKEPLIRKETLDAALKPCRHPSDPLPSAVSMNRDWFMLFGMGYGLWGEAGRMDRVFGHGGAGGSEALVDRDQRLIVAYTCNSCKDSTVLRDRLYEVVGMRWRYWNDNVNIQDLQMATSSGGSFGAGITSH